jgi:Protein-tyrosine-phosphatase
MAEGFVNALYGDRYEANSAGNEPTQVHPCAIEVMAEEGIDIASQRAKSLNEFDDVYFDYVVTLCADNHENCLSFRAGRHTSSVPLLIRCRARKNSRFLIYLVMCPDLRLKHTPSSNRSAHFQIDAPARRTYYFFVIFFVISLFLALLGVNPRI